MLSNAIQTYESFVTTGYVQATLPDITGFADKRRLFNSSTTIYY